MDRAIRRGEKLARSNWFSKSLFQETIGIIGMGNIGREVARKWFYAMDAALVAYDPYLPENGWPELPHKRAQNLEELLTVSDVVSIHVPLTPETRGLIGRKELALMKNKSNLLNLARGGIVDEPALLEALKAENFWGVGLDALNVEPLTIQVYHEFLESQRLIITPHVGGDTFETQVRSGIAAVDALLVALRGGEPKGRQA